MSMMQLDLDRAAVSRLADGSVEIDDPGHPVVTVAVDTGGSPRLTAITVRVRDDGTGLTTKTLRRLPLAQITHVAALRSAATTDINEWHWRSRIRPKPPGRHGWPEDHWPLVLDVYQWAVTTGRPGGGYQAVADLWCVTRRPTAYRWVAHARRVRSGAVRTAR